MTENSTVERCRFAVREALSECGQEDVTAEVLAKFDEIPYDGDGRAYAQAAANVVTEVLERKLAQVTARAEAANAELAAIKTFQRLPPSNVVH
jgi:NifU-like protein involved in Fe-S cluster formation